MLNNDVLRSARHMLNISNEKVAEIIKLGGGFVTPEQITAYLKKEDEPGFIECPQNPMADFLNGLIYFKRGRDETRPPLQRDLPTNNVVLKKFRVAYALKDSDILDLLKKTGFEMTKSELSALFRAPDHPNYREAGDQMLRNFLKGLTARPKS